MSTHEISHKSLNVNIHTPITGLLMEVAWDKSAILKSMLTIVWTVAADWVMLTLFSDVARLRLAINSGIPSTCKD